MFAVLSLCLIGLTFASPQTNYFNLPEEQWTEPETPEVGFLGLSSGASLVVPQIRVGGFSCSGRSYGYFADVENNCQIFYICHPSANAKGEPVIYQYSNFCPNQTRFDQRQHQCLNLNNPNLLPCEQSLQYYPTTESRFREAPVEVQRSENVEQIPVSVIAEQRTENLPIEGQRQGVLETTISHPAVKGFSSAFRTQTIVNREFPTKNIGRSESVQVLPQSNLGIFVSQPVVSQIGSLQTNVPVVRRGSLPTLSQSVGQQSVEQQSVQPIVPVVAVGRRFSSVQTLPQPLQQQSAPLVRNTPLVQTLPQPLEQQSVPLVRNAPLVQNIPQRFEQQSLPLVRNAPLVQNFPQPLEQQSLPLVRNAPLVSALPQSVPLVRNVPLVSSIPQFVEQQSIPFGRIEQLELTLPQSVEHQSVQQTVPFVRQFSAPISSQSVKQRSVQPVVPLTSGQSVQPLVSQPIIRTFLPNQYNQFF
jgi:hypothetical protein